MTRPTVSVVIPTFNRRDYVQAAINSVIDQTYPNFEIIVVDDGSTDGTAAILAGHTDNRVRVLRQPNSGRGAARNAGVSVSSGDYLAFLDDDDEFLPRKLEVQVAFLDRFPAVDLVSGRYVTMDAQGAALNYGQSYVAQVTTDLSVPDWLRSCPFLLQSILLRRRCWDVVGGFDPELRQAEDHDFFLRLAGHGCVMKQIDEPVFRYRYHSGNSVHNAFGQTQARIKMLDKFFASCDPRWKQNTEEVYSHNWLIGAMHAYAVGQIESATACMTEAIKNDPDVVRKESVVIIDMIASYSVWPLQKCSPYEYIKHIFHDFPQLAELRRGVHHVLAQVEMKRFFEANEDGQAAEVLMYGVSGIRHNPNWLRNRGVWSILARNLVRLPRQIAHEGVHSRQRSARRLS